MGKWCIGASALAGMLVVSSLARAQEAGQLTGSAALNQLDPAPPGDTFFSLPSPFALGDPVEARAAVLLDAARNPLYLLDDETEGAVVGTQMFLHVAASVAILDRLLVSMSMPVAVLQEGDSPTLQDVEVASPGSAELGDLQFGLRVRLFGEYDEPFQIGTGAYLWVPTGPDPSFVGEGSVRTTPYVSLGGTFEAGIPWWWTTSVGVEIRNQDVGSRMRYGAAFAAVFFDDVLQVGPEIYASTPIQEADFRLTPTKRIQTEDSTNVELLFGARARIWHFTAGAAGGPGLTRAIGTPSFRLLGSIAYSPGPDVEDSGTLDDDGDGIDNAEDECPDAHGDFAAGTARHGCPTVDDDEDGIPNHLDACPETYGQPDDDPKKNGCRASAAALGPRVF